MDKIYCPACHFNNPTAFTLCVQCGKPLPQKSLAQQLLGRVFPKLFQTPVGPISTETVETLTDLPVVLTTETGEGYTIGPKLGHGGYCTVHRVDRISDGQSFALKLCRLWETDSASHETLKTRFWMEYRLGQQANTDYFVKTYEKGFHRGNPFFLMDYCEGGSLSARVGQEWPDHRLKAIAVDLLRGLSQLHRSGIIHRDLKPSNVMFHQNRLKLIDFGVSGRLDVRMTKSHETLGTDVYMAPELFRIANKQYQSKLPTIDIFSFGVLLFELISKGYFPHGEPPSTANRNTYHEEVAEYSKRVQNENWIYLNQFKREGKFSDFWYDLIADCLRANPAHRIQNTQALLDRLGEVEPLMYCPRCQHEQPSRRVARCGYCGETLLRGALQLRVMVGPETGQCYDLGPFVAIKGLVNLGRYSDFELTDNDVSIREFNDNTPYISRFHATIERSKKTGEWFIRDGQWRETDEGDKAWLPSRNGVFVNAARASPDGMPIYPGDILTIGDITLRVELQP